MAEGAIITVKKEDFLKAEVSGKKLLLLQACTASLTSRLALGTAA